MSNNTLHRNDANSRGEYRVVTVVALEGRSEKELLALAAGLAGGLDPQVAAAIVDSARERGVDVSVLDGFQDTTSAGVLGALSGRALAIGNAAMFAELGWSVDQLCDWPERMRRHGQQVLLIAVNGRAVGFLGVSTAV